MTATPKMPLLEKRMLGKVVSVSEQLGYLVAPDAPYSSPRRYTFLLQVEEQAPTVGSVVTFTPEIAEGKKYGRATNVVVAIAAPGVDVVKIAEEKPQQASTPQSLTFRSN